MDRRRTAHLYRNYAPLCRNELIAQSQEKGPKGEGFEVQKHGHARVAMIGFPSVGKSTLLSKLTATDSQSAAYEFTTLTCIPGNIVVRLCRAPPPTP